MKRFRVRTALPAALAALLSGAAPASAQTAPAPVCRDHLATLIVGTREVPFAVEIADDPAERATGLMNRPALKPGTGMLFVFDEARPQSFWMKNTLVPLDILFMDEAGVVRHIHPDARPLDLTPLPGAAPGDPDPDRLMVLEIGGGEAARLGLRTGAVLRHPRLPQATAAAPCP
ncbi:DUF192 domain-containing protein [Paracoccus aeridis]|uniref:DUF192 domain-containing protein n=1 Tax=Paracoccus aeridis TaxID=1966466 RepID=UPI001F196909|nr:DUF192 domain-containing protein [Paracoccus aeridis]